MFGQVIVDAEAVLALEHEVFGHGNAGIRSQVLERCAVGSRSGDDDGIGHGAVFFQRADDTGYGRSFLADSDVDADDARILLVQNRIDGDGRLAGTTVTDDEFTLATADRDHGVDSLEACLERYLDRLAVSDAEGLDFDQARFFGLDFPFAVDRHTQGVDNAADHGFANRDTHDAACTADRVAFLDEGVIAEQYGADVVFFQVQGHAVNAVRQFQQFPGHGFVQTVNVGNAVPDFQNGADIVDVHFHIIIFDLFLDYSRYFFWLHFHYSSVTPFVTSAWSSLCCISRSCRRRLPSINLSPIWMTMPPISDGST